MLDIGYEKIHMVLPKGKASKALKFAKEHGVLGGTIKLAKGTVSDKLLNFLSIYEDDKEMLIMGCKKDTSKNVIPKLVEKFQLEKPNKGILFVTSVETVFNKDGRQDYNENLGDNMYKLLTIIVEKGKAEDIVETANKAGARGGTIINARGAGTAETRKVFNIEIEPEKEVLMIVAQNDKYDNIIKAINEKHEIDKPGHGIIFVQNIVEAHGLVTD